MDFSPFIVAPTGERPPKPRPLGTAEGLGDRMRTAAFAEFQAVLAFGWAADRFTEVSPELRAAWREQIPQEQLHYDLIVARMTELGLSLTERTVSRGLWDSLQECTTGQQFCVRIAAAEERGRLAALRLIAYLAQSDPDTAAVFERIAADEIAHVELANTHFGWTPTD